MVVDRMDIRRENGLGVVAHGNGRIGPPKEGLRKRRSVVELALNLYVCLVLVKSYGRDDPCSVHPVHITKEKALGAVGIVAYPVLNLHIGGWSVMLRPVKLYSS